MFDFFDELTQFFQQVVTNFNSFSDFLRNSLDSFSDALNFITDFSAKLPPKFAWIAPIVLMFMVFDYIRGR